MASIGVEDPLDELAKIEENLENPDADEEVLDEEKWASRWSFILAAVGSAIGLGNFWRFPFLAFKWGGVFLGPYLFALFLVGIPLMQLEMALGQVFRRAATQAFGRLDKRFRGIGLGAGMVAFGVVSYYNALLAWGNIYFINSFKADMPWSIRGVPSNQTLSIPQGYFVNEVLKLNDGKQPEINEILIPNLIGTLFQWLCVLLILLFGTEFISKAVWVTVLLPVVMLIVLIITGATLTGAGIGIEAYIGKWDFSLLEDGSMWVDAFGQIFFSLSLSVGVMPAYAAMNPRNADIVKDAMLVSVLNCTFSILAGFAVFTVAGYLSNESGLSFDDKEFKGVLGGPFLAFAAYPSGLSLLPGATANVMTAIFFLTFFFLGIDSSFSLVEAVVMNFRETKAFGGFTKRQFTVIVVLAGTIWSIFYCSDSGLHMLDIVDTYISGFGLLFFGFLEALVAGWLYKRDEALEKVGTPMKVLEFGYWGSVVLFILLSFGLGYSDLSREAVIGISAAVGIIGTGGSCVAAYMMTKSANPDDPDAVRNLFFYGINNLREHINHIVTQDKPGNWTFSLIWCGLIKYFISPCLLFLLSQRSVSFYDKEGIPSYSAGYEMMGVSLLIICVLLVVVGFFKPELYAEPTHLLKRPVLL